MLLTYIRKAGGQHEYPRKYGFTDKRASWIKKISQSELAEKVGYKDKTAIAKVEAGKVDLPKSKISSFAKALDTTTSYLFSDEQIENAYSYSLNKEFQPIIRQKLNYYNKNLDLKRNATLNKLKENLLETKNALIETTETLNERGERINLIMKKAETLKGDSKVYFDNAKKIKNKEKGFDCKYLYTALFVICFCYVLASILCGGVTLPNCFTE